MIYKATIIRKTDEIYTGRKAASIIFINSQVFGNVVGVITTSVMLSVILAVTKIK